MNLHRLSEHLCYLAGPMDDTTDGGKVWRQRISPFLWGLGIGVLDPCTSQEKRTLREQTETYMRTMQKAELCGEHEVYASCKQKIQQIIKPVCSWDLNAVDLYTFVILYIDTRVHMCGSYNEQTHACLQRKPVLILCEQGKYKVPPWLWGVCEPDEFFDDWRKLEQYIVDINRGKRTPHKKWHLLDMDKVFNRS